MDMSKTIKNPKAIWYWSLKPGLFVDYLSGKELMPETVSGTWKGTLEEWNSHLIKQCYSMSFVLANDHSKKDVLHVPATINSKLTKNMLEEWEGKVKENSGLPYNQVMIETEKGYGFINILNMNDKGNIV